MNISRIPTLTLSTYYYRQMGKKLSYLSYFWFFSWQRLKHNENMSLILLSVCTFCCFFSFFNFVSFCVSSCYLSSYLCLSYSINQLKNNILILCLFSLNRITLQVFQTVKSFSHKTVHVIYSSGIEAI